MDLIIEDRTRALGYLLDYKKVYFDLGDSNTFQITVRATPEMAICLKKGNLIYSPGTEYGGLIGRVKLSVKHNAYTVSGFTFRGLLEMKLIEPAHGVDYAILDPATFTPTTPDINQCIGWILENYCNDKMFSFLATEKIGIKITTKYQFKRYCTGLSGLKDFLKRSGCRVEIKALEIDGMCKVYVGAVPIATYKSLTSNDGATYFAADDNGMGINYLVALGKGTLKNRLRARLYVDEKTGTIKRQLNGTPGYPPVNGIIKAYLYELSSEDNWSKLRDAGIEKLKELMNAQSFSASVDNIDAGIGDIVGASEEIGGQEMESPIIQKMVEMESGDCKITYKTQSEGDVEDENY